MTTTRQATPPRRRPERPSRRAEATEPPTEATSRPEADRTGGQRTGTTCNRRARTGRRRGLRLRFVDGRADLDRVGELADEPSSGDSGERRRSRHRRRLRAVLRRRDRHLRRLPPDQGRRGARLRGEAGIEYVELQIAYRRPDGHDQPGQRRRRVPRLRRPLRPDRPRVRGLRQLDRRRRPRHRARLGVRDRSPTPTLVIYGPGRSRGTYDTFVEFVDRRARRGAWRRGQADPRRLHVAAPTTTSSSRASRQPTRSLGWVGFAFTPRRPGRRSRRSRSTAATGCVEPGAETIADGSYPLAAALYIYVNTAKAEENPAVAAFVDLYLSDQGLARRSPTPATCPARRSDPGQPGTPGQPCSPLESAGRSIPPGRPAEPGTQDRHRTSTCRTKRITPPRAHHRRSPRQRQATDTRAHDAASSSCSPPSHRSSSAP